MDLLVGLEHEFALHDGSRRVDFRSLVHRVGLRGARGDPADPNAYRGPWGGVITCDGAEAEIAIPPVTARRGFVAEVSALARRGRGELASKLPAGVELEGCSTHVSVSTAARETAPAARMYPETFAPGLMMLMDRATSPGLLVRPRPARLELCGEYTQGPQRRAAVAYAVGSALALRRLSRRALGDLRVRAEVVPAVHRYGWYVDRAAFGPDLYRDGRRARLERDDGGTIVAQDQLERCWDLARHALAGLVDPADLADADAIVTGRLPLASEQSLDDDGPAHANGHEVDLSRRIRAGFALEVHTVTWWFTVFEAHDIAARDRRVFVCVPGRELARFLDAVDRGAYDRRLREDLAHRPRARLEGPAQTRRVGVFGELGDPGRLLPSELDHAGRALAAGGGSHGNPRPGKGEAAALPPEARRSRRALLVGAAAAALVALVVGGVLATGGGGGGGNPGVPSVKYVPPGFVEGKRGGPNANPAVEELAGTPPQLCIADYDVHAQVTGAFASAPQPGTATYGSYTVLSYPDPAAAAKPIAALSTKSGDDCLRDAMRTVSNLEASQLPLPARPGVGDLEIATQRGFAFVDPANPRSVVSGTVGLYLVRVHTTLIELLLVTIGPQDATFVHDTVKAIVDQLG